MKLPALRQKFISGGYGYGHAKTLLYDRIMDYFSKSRKLKRTTTNNEDYIVEVLNSGAKTANRIASKKLESQKGYYWAIQMIIFLTGRKDAREIKLEEIKKVSSYYYI